MTWEIRPVGDSCQLTVIHDQLPADANPELYGGWPMILSGLKTLVETGDHLDDAGLAALLRLNAPAYAVRVELEVLQTDVTKLDVDAIANAANTQLLHGGGVAAAIARAGGPAVDEESRAVAPIGLGDAVETSAGDMPARFVIHAATMELGGPTSAAIIERATASTLARAEELGCRSLGLVAFGTGVGGFPLDEAARLMVGACRAHAPGSLERVVFTVHGDEAERAFAEALA